MNPRSASSEKDRFLSPNSEFLQARSLKKGLGRALVWQVGSSEKGKFLSPNSKQWQVPSSEKGQCRTLVQQFSEFG